MRDVRRTLDGVWRIESARRIAGIARIVRDVGLAEDLATTFRPHGACSSSCARRMLSVAAR
jgi:predicted RNA polymerase sigma factor